MLSSIASTVAGALASASADPLTDTVVSSSTSTPIEENQSTMPNDDSSVPIGMNRDEATQTSEGGDFIASAVTPILQESMPDPQKEENMQGSVQHKRGVEHQQNPPTSLVPAVNRTDAAGAAAASLAHSTARPTEIWKPNPSSVAGAAASLAHAAGASGGSPSLRDVPEPRPISPKESRRNASLSGAVGALGSRRQQSMEEGAHDRPQPHVLSAATMSMANEKRKRQSSGSPSAPKYYPNLEEAARRQAEERLARMGYTQGNDAAQPRSTSVHPVNLRAVQIEAELKEPDEDIEKAKKKGPDAELLMAAARKNVQARLSEQDRRIADSKGLIHRDKWTSKAAGVAQKQSDERMQHHGKIDIGGGRYMSQDDVDQIAERNLRPVLDEMDQRAKEHHQAIAEAKLQEESERLDRENEKRVAEFRRERQREAGAEIRKSRNGEKHRPSNVDQQEQARALTMRDRDEPGRARMLDRLAERLHLGSPPEEGGRVNAVLRKLPLRKGSKDDCHVDNSSGRKPPSRQNSRDENGESSIFRRLPFKKGSKDDNLERPADQKPPSRQASKDDCRERSANMSATGPSKAPANDVASGVAEGVECATPSRLDKFKRTFSMRGRLPPTPSPEKQAEVIPVKAEALVEPGFSNDRPGSGDINSAVDDKATQEPVPTSAHQQTRTFVTIAPQNLNSNPSQANGNNGSIDSVLFVHPHDMASGGSIITAGEAPQPDPIALNVNWNRQSRVSGDNVGGVLYDPVALRNKASKASVGSAFHDYGIDRTGNKGSIGSVFFENPNNTVSTGSLIGEETYPNYAHLNANRTRTRGSVGSAVHDPGQNIAGNRGSIDSVFFENSHATGSTGSLIGDGLQPDPLTLNANRNRQNRVSVGSVGSFGSAHSVGSVFYDPTTMTAHRNRQSRVSVGSIGSVFHDRGPHRASRPVLESPRPTMPIREVTNSFVISQASDLTSDNPNIGAAPTFETHGDPAATEDSSAVGSAVGSGVAFASTREPSKGTALEANGAGHAIETAKSAGQTGDAPEAGERKRPHSPTSLVAINNAEIGEPLVCPDAPIPGEMMVLLGSQSDQKSLHATTTPEL